MLAYNPQYDWQGHKRKKNHCSMSRLRRRVRTPPLETGKFFVANLSAVELPANSPMRRESPRPPERRDPDYDQKYDWLGLFYDVYWHGGRVAMVGPPLRNFASLVVRRESAP